MSTHVKVGIAAVIVAAIVGMIVIDQSSLGGGSSPVPAPSPQAAAPVEHRSGIVLHSPEVSPAPARPAPAAYGDPRSPIVERGLVELERVTSGIVKGARPGEEETPGIKGEVRRAIDPASSLPQETYEVQQGDTLFLIAEKKYGDGNLYPIIARANAKIDPNRLRVGQKLVIPPKEPPTAAPATDPPAVEEAGGSRTYTVRAGDTLGEIAMRVYRTARRGVIDRIIESNPGLDADGTNLRAGARLLLPLLDAEPPAPAVEPGYGPVETAGRTYKVQPNDSLWKIATRFRGSRDVVEMMDLIVSANQDRLRTKADPLRVDWVIVIPE